MAPIEEKKQTTLVVEKVVGVYADHKQVIVRDHDSQYEASDLWYTFNLEDRVVALEGFMIFGTARPFEINVTTEVHSEEPQSASSAVFEKYDHVTDNIMKFPSGKVVIISSTDDHAPTEKMIVEVDKDKEYLVRVLHSNLDKMSITSMAGDDSYRVVMWPIEASTSTDKIVVHKRFTPFNWTSTIYTKLNHYVKPSFGSPLFTGMVMIRHGNTLPHDAQAMDKERTLSEQGKEQCRKAGNDWYKEKIVPTSGDFVLSSAAGRCHETVQEVLSSAGVTDVKVHDIDYLYDGVTTGSCNELFQRIGYAPLSTYFETEEGKSAYTQYGETAMEKVLDAVRNYSGYDPTSATNPPIIVPVFGHAVHLPAMAFVLAKAWGLDEECLNKVLSFTQGEAEGILITATGVEFLGSQ